MKNNPLHGHGVGLVTPFHNSQLSLQTGSMDFPALEKMVARMVQSPVDFLVVLGEHSERSTLRQEERLQLVQFMLDVVKPPLHLFIGVGGDDPSDVEHQIQQLVEVTQGRDPKKVISGLLLASPVSGRFDAPGYVRHAQNVAECSPWPVVLHRRVDEPRGPSLGVDVFLQLAKDQRFLGVRLDGDDRRFTDALLQQRPPHFRVVTACDPMALSDLALGTDGVISAVGNALPEAWGRLVHQALFGDFSSARESHRLLYPLLTALDAVPTASGVKEVLTLIGQSNAGVRPPLSALNGPDRQRIYDALAALPPDWNPQLR